MFFFKLLVTLNEKNITKKKKNIKNKQIDII